MKTASKDRLSAADKRAFQECARAVRSILKLTNEQIAEGIGCSPRAITHALENGDKRPLLEPRVREIYGFLEKTCGQSRALGTLIAALNDLTLIEEQSPAAFRRKWEARQQKIAALRRTVDTEHQAKLVLAEFQSKAEWMRNPSPPAVLILSDDVARFIDTMMKGINVSQTTASQVRRGLQLALGERQRSRMARAWLDRTDSVAQRLLDKSYAKEFWEGEDAGFIARDIVVLSANIATAKDPNNPFPVPPPKAARSVKGARS